VMRHKRWLAAAVFLWCGCGRRPDPLPGFPRLVLWAWERPERLDFVNPRSAGVAYLARTVSWRAGQISSRPRLQPLRVPPGTPLMAVVRLESQGVPLPDAATVRAEILKAVAIADVKALQVDFDARLSERAWYAGLLRELRRGLDASIPLSITALASWCDRDSWMDGLPVSEAVPMLFRMGAGEPRDTRDFRVRLCRDSFGISTDEVPADLPHGRRLFVFHPRAWDEDAYRAAVRLAVKWR
jgi:Protein of unknown function (DUF3142)